MAFNGQLVGKSKMIEVKMTTGDLQHDNGSSPNSQRAGKH